MGELGYMPLAEYDPGAAFPGVLGRTTDEPGPAWPTGRRCPRRVPGGRDEVDARLWPLGSGDSRLGKGAVLFRNELVVADAAAGAARAAKPGEVRRLGKYAAIVVPAVGGGARI